jgi:hypothetical protein
MLLGKDVLRTDLCEEVLSTWNKQMWLGRGVVKTDVGEEGVVKTYINLGEERCAKDRCWRGGL